MGNYSTDGLETFGNNNFCDSDDLGHGKAVNWWQNQQTYDPKKRLGGCTNKKDGPGCLFNNELSKLARRLDSATFRRFRKE